MQLVILKLDGFAWNDPKAHIMNVVYRFNPIFYILIFELSNVFNSGNLNTSCIHSITMCIMQKSP